MYSIFLLGAISWLQVGVDDGQKDIFTTTSSAYSNFIPLFPRPMPSIEYNNSIYYQSSQRVLTVRASDADTVEICVFNFNSNQSDKENYLSTEVIYSNNIIY